MKLSISKEVICDALLKGGAAALSEEAQADTSTLSLLIQSVKMTVNGEQIVIESGTNLLYTKHSIALDEKDGKILENGSVVVPAKEFLRFVSAQGDGAQIGIAFNKMENSENISVSDDDSANVITIKKTGSIKLTSKSSKGKSKISGKWDLDCYDDEKFQGVDFSVEKEKCFSINGEAYINALNSILFAAHKKDYEHVLDSISFQIYKEDLYCLASDGAKCAIYKMPKESNTVFVDRKMLIPCSLTEKATKIIDKGKVIDFYYSETLNRVFVEQSDLQIRMACAEKKMSEVFPGINILLDKEHSEIVKLDKSSFLELATNASLVNNSSALFSFKKEDNSIMVKAISEDGKYKPLTKKITVDNVAMDQNLVWSVKNIIEGIKNAKSDTITISVPEHLKSVMITEDDGNYIYFSMALVNPMYKVG